MADSFFNTLAKAFRPSQYKHLSQHFVFDAFGFLMKLFILSFILMTLMMIPSFANIPDTVKSELHKVSGTFNGTINMTEPIVFPAKDPFMIIDTTGKHDVIGAENLLITKYDVNYRIYRNPTQVPIDTLKDFSNKGEWIKILVTAAIFLIPAVLFWFSFVLFAKYILIAVLAASLFWVVLDLTRFKRAYPEILVTALYATVFLIPLEMIFMPVSTSWMVPTMHVMRLPFYAVPMLIYLCFLAAAVYFIPRKYNPHPL